MYDINQVRADFPILSRTVYDKPLVYLDNAATTQKPLCVLDAMRDEYLNVTPKELVTEPSAAMTAYTVSSFEKGALVAAKAG